MYEWYREIAFEAELNTKEDPEFLELAREVCNENQTTRAVAITELRKMIFDREKCLPFRIDDEFLLRFLRVKKFVVTKAHNLLVRYCTFREEHRLLYEGVDLWGLTKLKSVYECNMYDRPDVGRILIIRFGMWDPNEYPFEDLARAATAMVEIGLRQPKLQVVGSTVIFDLEGATLKHVSSLTPATVYITVCFMGLAIPSRCRGVHVINYSWMLSTGTYLFKRFLPQSVWKIIHFHGNDTKSLHSYIDLECLPPRYGGTCKSFVDFSMWLRKIQKYRNELFDKEMKQLGYVIKD